MFACSNVRTRRAPVCLIAAGLAAVMACSRAAAPQDPAAPFLGVYTLDASNQTGPRSQLMMRVDRPATDIAVSFVYGPAGQVRSARIDGDSLVVVWAVRAGVPDYRFVLRRAGGDSVDGTWEGKEGRGTLRGRHAPSPEPGM